MFKTLKRTGENIIPINCIKMFPNNVNFIILYNQFIAKKFFLVF